MDKKRLKELCEKATPGPWHIGGKDHTIVYAGDGYATASCAVYHGRFRDGETESNARLIAAAREAVPALLAEIEELKRERDGLRKELKLRRGMAAITKGISLESVLDRAESAEAREKDLAAWVEKVKGDIERIPVREESLGGQWTEYVQREAVLELFDPIPGSADRLREEAEEGLTVAYLKGKEEGRDEFRGRVAVLEEAAQILQFASDRHIDGNVIIKKAAWDQFNKALTSPSPSPASEVLRAARNFARVREFPDYNDKAHKSAGWYLAEAVRKMEGK